ncbi:MAG: alanine--tRNA ligase [Bacteroidota bacterium]|nr:alanine--tRNA ligase [Bacteroidota bacterium]
MISAKEIRLTFLEFFKNKNHHIVASAPVVIKNDPTLMFTNAGMNQFKDYFLGNKKAPYTRIADTQKCLRVSGKHNDLEEVGVDHYHHTLFEMLGNWSFGDYFKKEAIAWSWELLTEVYKIDKDSLYVTVFEGDESEGLAFDQEAYDYWAELIDPSRILKGNKKDNFWEMGDTGPCGPCSEIHVDLRDEGDKLKVDGALLVNNDHPEVIEIWNNVFMEFNRKADGSLDKLPSQHVDTGMGFERLTRVLQNKKSNYDTDIFQPIIQELEKITGYQYEGTDAKKDIAFRVIADHVRAVAFTIADGQLPSNTGAGYVIRRILRRAIRYGYSYLGIREPFIYKLIPVLTQEFGSVFPELAAQQSFIAKVIQEEGNTFLRTLSVGLDRISSYLAQKPAILDAETTFELYDTFGFPIDLTQLICSESQVSVDIEGFNKLLEEQKTRSRKDAEKQTGDWNFLLDDDHEEFIGYDFVEATIKIVKYRTMTIKNKEQYQLVFNVTPFYGESGGQVGDKGIMTGVINQETIQIIDTQKENDLIVHICDKLPENKNQSFEVKVDVQKRALTTNNHSATHLLHAALKDVLGAHIAQKGSLVNAEYLRFDFNHFAKVTDEELAKIENIVNQKINENIALDEQRYVPIKMATEQLGATALFGEKYGDLVRVITFDKTYSVELCGGTHVKNTGMIKSFKIVSESSVAAGVRRIEAITSQKVDELNAQNETMILKIKELLGNPKEIEASLIKLIDENKNLSKQIELLEAEKAQAFKNDLMQSIIVREDYHLLVGNAGNLSSEQVKNICFQIRNEVKNILGVIVNSPNSKPSIAVFASDDLVASKNINCQTIVRDLAKHIEGGGGGQAFFATAGGKNINGIDAVIKQAEELSI